MNSSPPVKIRDIPPTAVRLKPDLRESLAREAAINGRSLHAEILFRLAGSLQGVQGEANTQSLLRHQVSEPGAEWVPHQTDAERTLLSIYKRLSPEKQLALLSLLK